MLCPVPNCKKKITTMNVTCRCGLTTCMKHRYPEDHGCTFDHKKEAQKELSEANPKIISEKIRKI